MKQKNMSDNIGKVYNLIASKLFGILSASIIFSPTAELEKRRRGGGSDGRKP